jgi:Ca-activated chloride channel homolog
MERWIRSAGLVLLASSVGLLVSSAALAQGLLIPTDERLEPLALASHEVRVEIQDHGAVTHVTQEFENRTGQMLEATYYFAIPPGSVTTDFALWMNGERISGEVLPRDQARATYEGIVRRMRDPGLLEYVDGELFQARIFPVPANGRQRVEIAFATTLRQQGDTLHYRYPVHASAGEIGSFVVEGTVASRHPIASLYAPYHAIDESATGERSRRFSMEQQRVDPTQDFELFIGLAGDDVGFSMLTWDDGSREDGYFMLTLAPSPELEQLDVLPKQVTFVVDTSGSMSGDKMTQAREMLRYSVRNLRPDDTFQLIGFSGSVQALFETPRPASRGNINEALAFIDAMQPRGNTNISDALARALQDPATAERPHTILFVTDGLPTAGETRVDQILQATRRGISDGDRRVFAFGVGYDVNTSLLDGIAQRGRGESGYVRPGEDMSDIIGTFYDGIGAPLLTQLAIDFGDARVSDVYPNPLPDLYRGRSITVFGRIDANQSGAVVVRGRAARETVTIEHGADFSAPEGVDTSFVASLWASRRVQSLLDAIAEEGETTARREEVVALATRWGIVTPYTSYLAVEPGEQLVQQPTLGGSSVGRGNRGPAPAEEAEPAIGGAPFYGVVDRGGHGGGAGVTRSSGATRTDAPPAPRAAAAPLADQDAVSGAAAVEGAIARNERRQRTVLDEAQTTQQVGQRTFSRIGEVWVEQGLEQRTADRVVDAMSDAYFALLRDNPDLRAVLSLGDRVRFRHAGAVWEVR